jgi:hypothetical protein
MEVVHFFFIGCEIPLVPIVQDVIQGHELCLDGKSGTAPAMTIVWLTDGVVERTTTEVIEIGPPACGILFSVLQGEDLSDQEIVGTAA